MSITNIKSSINKVFDKDYGPVTEEFRVDYCLTFLSNTFDSPKLQLQVLEVIKEIYGDKFPDFKKGAFNSICGLFDSAKKDFSDEKLTKSYAEYLLKTYKCLDLNSEIKIYFNRTL
jgi:hypothetical protein